MDGQSLMMRCRDAIRQGGSTFGYELTREIRLCEQGLDSVSTLRLSVPWNHPVTWFAHPFFAQSGGEATGFVFAGEVVTNGPLTRDSGGAYRLPPQGGLGNVLGLWGDTRPILCRLDEALGGGVVSVQVDRPLDHAVIYASPLASSVEPQLARIWKDGEQASWTIRYRWLG
jgi:hypothetical protein